MREFEKGLNEFVDLTNPGVLSAIEEKKILDDELRKALTDVIKQYKDQFVSEHQAVAKATA